MNSAIIDPNIAFRKKDLQKAANLINLRESFNVVGQTGIGKSRFLRHLAFKKSFSESIKDTNLLIIYLDLRGIDTNLINEIQKELQKHLKSKTNSIESTVKTLLEEYDSIYIIFDESNLFTNYEVSEINKLRSLRDSHKYKLNFIFSYYKNIKKTEIKYELNALFEIAKYSITLNPLEKGDMIDTIEHILNGYNFTLEPQEIEKIVTGAKGYPGMARNLILNQMLGETSETGQFYLDTNRILEESLYFLTKNEFLILKAIIGKPNYFIEKDEIALIISPESEGMGVSDAAISQLIKRLRTKLKKHKTNITIKTKRGYGYFIE